MKKEDVVKLLGSIAKEKSQASRNMSMNMTREITENEIEALNHAIECLSKRETSSTVFELIDYVNEWEHIDAMMCGINTDWYNVYICLRVLYDKIKKMKFHHNESDINFSMFVHRHLKQHIEYEKDRIINTFGQTFPE